jgi:hypothetical protein
MANKLQNVIYERYNYDDVFNRVIIIGLLNLLNHGITYTQTWDDKTVETVNVPFMYETGSSDERFMQDNYTFFGRECFSDKLIDGKFDMLPRGTVKYNGSQIDSGNITNRFVQGRYLKNENGKLTSYTSFLYSIPITFNFDIEMWIDNIVTAFKIEQSIRETFYKNRTFYVLFRGIKIGCCVGFPESTAVEKTTSYSFDNERQIKMTFSLAVETYQPAFDNNTAIESSKRIESIAYDITTKNSNVDKILSINIKNFDNSIIYPSGATMLIEWDNYSTVSDMCTIGISYVDSDNVEHTIDRASYNNHSYMWNIPEGFTDYIQPQITYFNNDQVITQPIIKIIPDPKTHAINEESFIIIDPGMFNTYDSTIKFTLDYMKTNGEIITSDAYSFNIVNRCIDISNPVTIEGDKLVDTRIINYKQISIKVTYPLDTKIFDETDKLLIL